MYHNTGLIKIILIIPLFLIIVDDYTLLNTNSVLISIYTVLVTNIFVSVSVLRSVTL